MAYRVKLGSVSKLALAALLLAAPQAMPVVGAPAAEAATKKRTAAKKPAAKKPATTKRVCTTAKVKGKLVKTCKTVKIVPVPPPPPPVVVTTAVPVPAPAPEPQRLAAAPVPPPPAPVPAPPPPPAQPPAEAYFYIDLADSLAAAIGDAPPDYTFRYDGIDSWAWVSRAGETLIVEPGRDGIVQYYFYQGETAPYLVRDSYYAYAFDGTRLVQVYDDRGRLFTGQLSWRQRDDSRVLFDRGRALLSAAWRSRNWNGDAALSWYGAMNGGAFYYDWSRGWSGSWNGDWRRRSDWRAFEYDQFGRMPPRYLDDERRRRKDSAWRYDQWRRGPRQAY